MTEVSEESLADKEAKSFRLIAHYLTHNGGIPSDLRATLEEEELLDVLLRAIKRGLHSEDGGEVNENMGAERQAERPTEGSRNPTEEQISAKEVFVERAFDAIIEDIRARRGTTQVSKQELLLEIIRNRQGHEVDLADLAPVFEGSATEPERLAQKKISELNAKLADFGLQIKRSPVYRVTRLNDKR